MKLKDYLKTQEGKTLKGYIYWAKNGRCYEAPISRASKTALDMEIEQINVDEKGEEWAWLF